jgi:hypothetical protein
VGRPALNVDTSQTVDVKTLASRMRALVGGKLHPNLTHASVSGDRCRVRACELNQAQAVDSTVFDVQREGLARSSRGPRPLEHRVNILASRMRYSSQR